LSASDSSRKHSCSVSSGRARPASAISAALLKASPDDDDEEAGGSVGQRNADRPYAPRRARAILFAAVTALFTAAILLFIVALAFLTFS